MAFKIVNGKLVVVPDDAEIASKINEIYQKELGGNADAGGLQFYTDLYKSGVGLDAIQAQIEDSPEGRLFDELQQASGSRQTITEQGAASAFDLKTQDIYGTDPYVEAVQTFQEEAYKPKTTKRPGTGASSTSRADELAQYGYINNLYLNYLGRPATLDELQFYTQRFGSSVDQDETRRFILGGVSSGEISQERADALLAALKLGGGDLTGGDLTDINLDGVDLTPGGDNRTRVIELYETQLGRTPSEAEIQNWLSNLNDKYTFADLERDFAIGAQREIGYNQRREFVKNIPKFQQTVVPEIEFPTEERLTPILGLTGLPTSSQNIQNLYRSYLGRTPSPQEIAVQQQIMGPVISPLKAYDFTGAVAQELAGAEAPRSFGGASLLTPPATFTQPTLTTATNQPNPVALDALLNSGLLNSLTNTGGAFFGAANAPVESRAGGMINYAEGGDVETAGSRALTPAELGSKFDVSEFIDEEGRLVGGYSRPIRDEYGVIIGYEERPYERDVVFGEELRRRQAAAPLDTEQAMLDMLARQGRTGVNPMTGGLAGIQVGGPMMRRLPQYYSTIEAGRRYRGFAKGGLADVAQELASKGRGGDTMLAHINPQEAGLLKALGGSGTINPETGLPEFIQLFPKKGIKLNLGPLGNIKVGAKSSSLLQAAGALAAGQFIPPMFSAPALSVGQTALAYGGLRGLATGNLAEGIQAGLTAYGMGSAYNQFADTPLGPTVGGTGGGTGAVGTGAGGGAAESAAVTSQNVPIQGTEAEFLAARPEFGQATNEALSGMATELPETTLGLGVGDPSTMSALERADIMTPPGKTAWTPPAPVETGSVDFGQGYLRKTLPASVQEYIADPILDASGKTLLAGAGLTTAAAGMQADKARAAQLRALAAAEEEKRKKFFAPEVAYLRSIPIYGRSGGLAKLAGGGMTYMEAGGTTGATGEPRDVTGTGDGMSDSVPASIEGVQEARLADGEFVIPADVVADIGNGSSDAGSKKLYDMMDRIRQARHGTTEQPPEIKAERLMPA